jgi:hypothetical protein
MQDCRLARTGALAGAAGPSYGRWQSYEHYADEYESLPRQRRQLQRSSQECRAGRACGCSEHSFVWWCKTVAQPFGRGEAQRQYTRPGLAVRCTFSPARAWRIAAGPTSPQTLGHTGAASAGALKAAVAAQHQIQVLASHAVPRFQKWSPVPNPPSPRQPSPQEVNAAKAAMGTTAAVPAFAGVVAVVESDTGRGQGFKEAAAFEQAVARLRVSGLVFSLAQARWRSQNHPMQTQLKLPARVLPRVWPNHSLNRTHCGMPPMASISFWAMRVTPQVAG